MELVKLLNYVHYCVLEHLSLLFHCIRESLCTHTCYFRLFGATKTPLAKNVHSLQSAYRVALRPALSTVESVATAGMRFINMHTKLFYLLVDL